MLQCCMNSKTEVAIAALKTSLAIVKLWQCPWEGAGGQPRATSQEQGRGRCTGMKQNGDQKGGGRKLTDKNPTKWYVGDRTRNLGLSGMYPETKYTSSISNWLSHGHGYHNLLIEIEKLVQGNGIYIFIFFSLLDFVLKI